MATNHKFKATSASMFVDGFSLVGHFVLNGSVNAEGSVNITPSANPGQEAASYTGDLTSPKVNIEFNSVGFNALSQRLRAAHSVEISFTTARDLVSTFSSTRIDNFSISARRTFE
jgi:hypothetical protein